jgi:hypothetical protein
MITHCMPSPLQRLRFKRKVTATPTDESSRVHSPFAKNRKVEPAWEQLPPDLALFILEFHSFRVSDFETIEEVEQARALTTLFGFFIKDPTRHIKLIFPHLDLSCAILSWPIHTEHTRAFQLVVPRKGYLTSICMSNNMLTNESLSCIFDHGVDQRCTIETYLTKLDMSNNILLTECGFKDWLFRCSKLVDLDLGCTDVSWELIRNAIQQLPKLKRVQLRGMREPIRDEQILSIDIALWAKLEVIDVSYNDITDAGAFHLLSASALASSRLKCLNLAKNSIRQLKPPLNMKIWSKRSSLQSLNLSLNELSTEALLFLSRFTSIRELHLYRCGMNKSMIDALCSQPEFCSDLKLLDLSDNEGLSAPDALRSFRKLRLEALILDGVELGKSRDPTTRLKKIVDITSIQSLQRLELDSCSLDDWCVKLLLYTIPCTMTKLNLSHNPITDQCLVPVQYSATSSTMRCNFASIQLNLSHNHGIGDYTSALLPYYFPNLRHLNVSYCNIGAGAGNLFSLKSLQSINMRGNRTIGDAVVLKILENSSVRWVDLSKNNIQDAGAYLLITKNKSIVSLDLRENCISDRIIRIGNQIDTTRNPLKHLDLSENSLMSERCRQILSNLVEVELV